MQAVVLLLFTLERSCCFSKKDAEVLKGLEEKETMDEKIFHEMSYFNVFFTLLLILVKLALLFGNRMVVSESAEILYCDVDGDYLYFTEDMGLQYMCLFAFQFTLGAALIRISLYEGVIRAGVFKK